jgi:hypothetical protein
MQPLADPTGHPDVHAVVAGATRVRLLQHGVVRIHPIARADAVLRRPKNARYYHFLRDVVAMQCFAMRSRARLVSLLGAIG